MHRHTLSLSLLLATAAGAIVAHAAPEPPWTVASYPDEAGYQQRIAGMIERIAAIDYLPRIMSASTCPDTGLPVRTWALEGEEILSPYTGRRYTQGPTGYFGPKRRDAQGRISHFGGDPLKQALPPAAAALILAPPGDAPGGADLPPSRAAIAQAYLSIPGNLRQHYHFACVNWARFLPLAGHRMPPAWHDAFRDAVAVYEENRRPSDGAVREYQPLPRTETLLGLAEEHLGGGGTENHKTMWRTSGLLYAQLLPKGSLISGKPQEEAIATTNAVLTRYIRGMVTVGNGEYDSSTYYPYSLRAFLNLHDFSPDAATRAWAKAALDYYVATYGLKMFNGVLAGPQRRGWVNGWELGEMDQHVHAWVPDTTVPVDPSRFITTLHQATSSYRPNRVIARLIAKDVALPFEAEIAHPDYGMTRRNTHPEYLYVSRSFAMGSVQLDAVNNAGQQTTWSLNVRGPRGSLIFGGGQPRWLHPEGHSPYDQWVQKRGALVFMTAPTALPAKAPPPARYTHEALQGARSYARADALAGPLEPSVPPPQDPAGFAAWFEGNRTAAATWLFVPRDAAAKIHVDAKKRIVVETPDTWVRITPFHPSWYWVEPPAAGEPEGVDLRGRAAVLTHYRLLVIPGDATGFAIDAIERAEFPSLDSLPESALRVDTAGASYRSMLGDDIRLDYRATSLRPEATINGSPMDWETWAKGGVYDSPYLKIKDGRLWISDGTEAYEMDCTGATPVWRQARP